MASADVLTGMLLYLLLPLWLGAGFADYLCHRAARIELTSGWKESVLHLLQLAQMAVAIVSALFFEITSGVIILMIGCLILHQITAMVDVRYASNTRSVSPVEQHVHSLLEMLPLTALLLVIAIHWNEFTALLHPTQADLSFRLRNQPLPISYVVVVLCASLVFEALPYLEELVRGVRARNHSRRE